MVLFSIFLISLHVKLDHSVPRGCEVHSSNPGYLGKTVGSFKDPSTGEIIVVVAKRGEEPAEAMNRVKKRYHA